MITFAERRRMDIGNYFKNILEDYDVLITPTTAMTAFDAGQNMLLMIKTAIYGMIGRLLLIRPILHACPPLLSTLVSLESGLPVGMQIMGGFLKDTLVLQVADAFQKNSGDIQDRMPPLVLS